MLVKSPNVRPPVELRRPPTPSTHRLSHNVWWPLRASIISCLPCAVTWIPRRWFTPCGGGLLGVGTAWAACQLDLHLSWVPVKWWHEEEADCVCVCSRQIPIDPSVCGGRMWPLYWRWDEMLPATRQIYWPSGTSVTLMTCSAKHISQTFRAAIRCVSPDNFVSVPPLKNSTRILSDTDNHFPHEEPLGHWPLDLYLCFITPGLPQSSTPHPPPPRLSPCWTAEVCTLLNTRIYVRYTYNMHIRSNHSYIYTHVHQNKYIQYCTF